MSLKSVPAVLIAHANNRADEEQYLRNLTVELKKIRAALKPARRAGLCNTEERGNASVEEVFEVFRDNRDRLAIFHFAGHTSSAELLFENAIGAPQLVQAGGLAEFLGQQKGLVLVFINGCSSADQVDELVAVGVPAVIATKAEIDDRIATAFAAHFYRGLASGASIQQAYFEAKAAISSTCKSPADACNQDHEDFSADDTWPWGLYEGNKTLGLAARWKLTTAVGHTPGGQVRIPELLPYMADRSQQRDQLADALESYQQKRARRPFITVVTGDEREAHKAFVERLQQATIPNLMNLNIDSEPIHLFSLNWGEPGAAAPERFRQLRRKIAEKLTGNRASSLDDMVAAVTRHQCPVMIAASIYSQRWQREEPDLIGLFTRFWQEWPDLPAGQPLFIVLSFIFKDDSGESIWSRYKMRRKNKAAQEYVDTLADSTPDNINLTVLDPLCSISEEDVKIWIEIEAGDFLLNTAGGHGGGVELSEAMMEWVEKRFRNSRDDNGGSRIPMRDLARELREKLNRYITERGI